MAIHGHDLKTIAIMGIPVALSRNLLTCMSQTFFVI